MRLWVFSFMLAILFPIEQGTAQTDTQRSSPTPPSKTEWRDSSIPLTQSVKPNENQPSFLPAGEDPENRLVTPFLEHLALDQKQFWATPFHLDREDAKYLVPFAAFTGALIAGDSWISRQVPASQINRSKSISDYATYSLIGAAGASYLWGHFTHNDHLGETGFLAGQAAFESAAVTYLLKTMTQRPRPLVGNGKGTFYQGGTSFPSEHSAIAWSIASVVAHEYPGTWTKIAAYGLASTVTLTRVTDKQHFSSDVVVGSALGWYLARQIYRAHHDPEVGGTGWGNFEKNSYTHEGEKVRNPANMGSPYVPLDSWIYPAFSRLIALGSVRSANVGIRPWTRMECARLLEEARAQLGDDALPGSEAQNVYQALAEEFVAEAERLDGSPNLAVRLDSVYTRSTGISGTPLRDGYHFGQTITNDYGRPYGEGFNNVTGVAGHAVAGPFSFYFRGEYQHAPGSPSAPAQVLQAIANADLTLPVSNATPNIDRLRLVEGAIALNFHNLQISFGKQGWWLGPGDSGSLLLSNNASSFLMLKLDNVSPYRIPLLSKVLGPVRTEYFLGQLSGTQFELNGSSLVGPGNIKPQPFLDGVKISFKPTPNLEIGMGATAMFAGPGLPFTWTNFIKTFYFHTNTGPTVNGNNPAKRASAVDVSYRIPHLRNWLTVYCDALAVDEISPIGSSRPVLNPGFYIPQFPKLHKLELRAEGIHEPLTSEFAPGFVYYGLRRYRSGYTNDGQLLGSWIGRAGRGGQAWLTYSFSPRDKFQLGYRQQEVSRLFIGGGRSVDYSARVETMLRHDIGLSGFLQYEQWKFPVLAPGRQIDFTSSFQLTFYPKWQIRKSER
jgi:membrane-associated phospholipid phosphatase